MTNTTFTFFNTSQITTQTFDTILHLLQELSISVLKDHYQSTYCISTEIRAEIISGRNAYIWNVDMQMNTQHMIRTGNKRPNYQSCPPQRWQTLDFLGPPEREKTF